MDTWDFQWVTSWDMVMHPDFLAQWSDYFKNAHAPTVFSHPKMAKAWIETYRNIRNMEPLFCIAHGKGTTVYYPLVVWKRNWKHLYQKTIVPVGYSDFDYNEPLVVGDRDHFDMGFFLEELVHCFQRENIRYDAIHLSGITQVFSTAAFSRSSGEICPYLHLDKELQTEVFLKSFKAKLLRNIRRSERRLGEKGILEHKVLGNERELINELEKALEHHQKRWPKAYKAPHLHVNLVLAAHSEGLLYFSALRLNGKSIGWILAFRDASVFYGYLMAFDNQFFTYSPNKIMLLESVKWAKESQLETFDFLRGDEAYKDKWTNDSKQVFVYSRKGRSAVSRCKNTIVDSINKIKVHLLS